MNQTSVANAAMPTSRVAAARRHAAPRSRTIGFWLVLLVTASMLPVSIVAAWLLVLDYRQQQELVLRESIGTARALISAVDRELAGARSALVALSSSRALATDDLARFHEQARHVQQNLPLANIVLFDPQGQQRMNTLIPFGAPLPKERNAALLEVPRIGRPVITDLFKGAITGKPIVAVAIPLPREGAGTQVLGAGVWPDRLAEVLTRERLPRGWIAAIFDSTGTIVARTHESDRFVGRKGSAQLVERMAVVAEDSIDTVSLEGIPLQSSFSRSAESNWSVAIGIPRDALLAQLHARLLWLTMAVVLLLSLSLVLASSIGARIGGAIRALIGPAHALGRGEPVHAPRLLLREADELGSAMAQTSLLLQSALHRAHHDPLTGLANRTLFGASIEHAMHLADRHGSSLALLYIDLDGFKAVNDRRGHAAGDDLLRTAARRLSRAVRESDIGARLGGDEFGVLLPDTDAAGATAVAAQLVSSLGGPYDLAGESARVTASVGIALYPACAATADDLLHLADEAMYQAKAAGGGRAAMAPLRP
ncbi:MAG TPA: sensor domain-containing diguanylate cyclase [Albitalea sp.]|nr:sensor domain-containing diguanylate cyclase [Albitalea sp.]